VVDCFDSAGVFEFRGLFVFYFCPGSTEGFNITALYNSVIMDTSDVTQSDKIVKCPKCGGIKKATGDSYFICCGHRWDIARYRLAETRSDLDVDDSYEPKRANSEPTQRDGGPGDKSKSDPEARQSQPRKGGKSERKDSSESLNFV
jgi:hypothetical protein